MRRDPARRGLASYTHHGTPLCAGHLAAAAGDLASRASVVAITTGFAIADAVPVTAETDGPPGALFLARALISSGVEALIITDRYARPALEAGCDFLRLPRSLIHEFPLENAETAEADRRPDSSTAESSPVETPSISTSAATPHADAWVDSFLASVPGSRLSHLIAVERVGPSHTLRSFLAQKRVGAALTEEFHRELPPTARDVCHNMRGTPIDASTGRIHRLFEAVGERQAGVTTIGIADGGNEIGCGAIPWETVRAAVKIGPGGRVACRISTDFTLLAGVSDWGALALAQSFIHLRGTTPDAAGDEESLLGALVQSLVREAGAVDGVTGRREPTVDGLPLPTYLQVFAGIRALCTAGAS